jgi:hypothetical protein
MCDVVLGEGVTALTELQSCEPGVSSLCTSSKTNKRGDQVALWNLREELVQGCLQDDVEHVFVGVQVLESLEESLLQQLHQETYYL